MPISKLNFTGKDKMIKSQLLILVYLNLGLASIDMEKLNTEPRVVQVNMHLARFNVTFFFHIRNNFLNKQLC